MGRDIEWGESLMDLSQLASWFTSTDDILEQIARHLYLSFLPVLAALAVALPAGLYIGHARRFEVLAVALANLGRAIPSFAILSLALILSIRLGLGLGFWPTFAALFFLSLPPILVNAHIGVRGVDPDVVESARGMGLKGRQVLTRVELPLAAPLILSGARTASVQSVATATLGALVAAGGLGEYIVFGFRANRDDFLLGGAILVASLALATEVALGAVEKLARPRGVPRPATSRVEPFEETAQVSRRDDAA